jgi:hypothetical protein
MFNLHSFRRSKGTQAIISRASDILALSVLKIARYFRLTMPNKRYSLTGPKPAFPKGR